MTDDERIQNLIDGLANEPTAELIEAATKELISLRNTRAFALVDRLAETLKKSSDDPSILKLQAQSLIELGKVGDASDILDALIGKLAAPHKELVEAVGLKGRAYKQIFFDARDKSSPRALEAVEKSLTEYKRAYELPPGRNAWPGVNVLAIAAFAERTGIAVAAGIDKRALARELLDSLDQIPPEDRDNWYHASRAEAYLGLGDLDAVEVHIGRYARSDATNAFALAGTLRQFTDLWGLDQQGPQGSGIMQALRTALANKPDGRIEVTPGEGQTVATRTQPTADQLQKILGFDGLKGYEWMVRGVMVARAVGVISMQAGGRIGTGFLVRGGDLIPSLGDERILMTNAHVISEPPFDKSVPPDAARVAFDAVDRGHFYTFPDLIWQSGPDHLDCTLLRLSEQPQSIEPLVLNKYLPTLVRDENRKQPRVYVIGYPRGGDLAFSLQDNILIDHEGPPDGHPPDASVRRLHYRAPTEPGSSGSPVFDESLWRVVALHHAGDKAMARLNGVEGTWPANEGIWIQSIVEAVRGNSGP